ncbi:hypothetical protein ACLOJK_026389 [Asimina triloba]
MSTRKATLKFRILQQQVLQALYNTPHPGPATFVVSCLYLLPLYGPPYSEGFSHLLMSSLRRLQTVQRIPGDASEAKRPAAQLFLDILTCSVIHEERIVVKLLEIFDIGLKDIAQVICGSAENGLDVAKACIERYIFKLIESQSYMTAVTLLEHFSIRSSGQSFLLRMLQDNQFKAAEKWATFMGKPMICVLVQKYLDLKMLKNAYDIIKQNNLRQEFPDACHLYKESSLKKLAEKGCWDVAEMKTNNNRQLVEYLVRNVITGSVALVFFNTMYGILFNYPTLMHVYLAMEAGYTEKVDELCERYSLKGFVKVTGPEASPPQTHYLNITELVIEDIVWVDDVDGMLNATSHIEGCKVVGMDCEWKPNYTKGGKPNKVVLDFFVNALILAAFAPSFNSMNIIASERTVFILDLIKLSADVPHVLDSCLKRILRSPRILKLGYNLQCDLRQLSHSYEELECFKYYEMLLDIQKLFNETRGGLSGLTKMEYAALDAAVLVHIFHHVRGQSQSTGLQEERAKVEWKSHIVSHMGKTKPPLKTSKKTQSEAKPAETPTL